jgi:hypothetical protein
LTGRRAGTGRVDDDRRITAVHQPHEVLVGLDVLLRACSGDGHTQRGDGQQRDKHG